MNTAAPHVIRIREGEPFTVACAVCGAERVRCSRVYVALRGDVTVFLECKRRHATELRIPKGAVVDVEFERER